MKSKAVIVLIFLVSLIFALENLNSEELGGSDVSENYFYIAPTSGIGFGCDNGYAFGVTVGKGSEKYGRLGVNFTSVIKNSTYNISLQYEKPFVANKTSSITPKLGLGYISDSYKDKYAYSHYNGNSYSTYYDSYNRKVDSFGLIIGLASEVRLNTRFYLKLGYDWFYGINDTEASNGALLLIIGYKLHG